MANHAPIKVGEHTKERIRYLAALMDVTQAEVVDRAVAEFTARHAEDVKRGIDRARVALSGGDEAIASYLLDVPVADVHRIAGSTRATPLD